MNNYICISINYRGVGGTRTATVRSWGRHIPEVMLPIPTGRPCSPAKMALLPPKKNPYNKENEN